MALYGSGERRVRLKAVKYVAWAIPGKGTCVRDAVRFEVAATPYRLFPLIHISNLKRVKIFPDRPKNQLSVEEKYHLDFDKTLLPEDNWERPLDEDEFEVEKILYVRSGRKPRYGRIERQNLVQWKGSGDPTWIDKKELNGAALMQEFDRDRVSKNLFEVMQ